MASGWVGKVRLWWLDTPKPIRVVVYVCVPLGACGVAVGVYGDLHGWWEHRSFSTNLTSSLTSVLFGIPTAVLILSHLGNAQAESLRRRQIRRRAKREIAGFQEVLLSPFPAPDLTTLRAHLTALIDLCKSLQELPQLPSLSFHRAAEEYEAGADRSVERWVHDVSALEESYGHALARLGPITHEALGIWYANVVAGWSALDDDLRPLIVETDQAWLPLSRVFHLRSALDGMPRFALTIPLEPEKVLLGTSNQAVWRQYDDRRNLIHERLSWLSWFEDLLNGVDELAVFYSAPGA